MKDPESSIERIGQFFVKIGAISPQQVQEILEIQKKEPDMLFGEIALKHGYITDQALDQYLKSKK